MPETRVAAVCDIRRDKAEALAADLAVDAVFDDLERMLDSGCVDAVYLATPPPVHAAQSIMALRKGIHVLCEVPAVHTLDEWTGLLAAADQSRAVYRLAENLNHLPVMMQVGAMAAHGVLGEITYAYGEYLHDVRDLLRDEQGNPTWRARYPAAIQYSTHELGPILEILNDSIVSVSTSAPGQHSGRLADGMSGTNVAVFRTRRDAIIVQRNDFASPRPSIGRRYVIQGSLGMVEVSYGRPCTGRYFLEKERQAGWQDLAQAPPPFAPPDESGLPPWALSGGHGTVEYHMVRGFLDAVRQGARQGRCDVRRGLEMSLPGIVAAASLKQDGALLPVPQVPR